jgi:hypothetical protein
MLFKHKTWAKCIQKLNFLQKRATLNRRSLHFEIMHFILEDSVRDCLQSIIVLLPLVPGWNPREALVLPDSLSFSL